MSCDSVIDSRKTGRPTSWLAPRPISAPISARARAVRMRLAGVQGLVLAPVSVLAMAALLVMGLAGCKTTGGDDNGGEGKTVLSSRKGESSIQVTESEQDGSQIVRIKTVFRGEENIIVLNIDQPVYEVEIPLSLDQVMPKAARSSASGPEGQFQDLLIAQYLEKAQQYMVDGDYNAALRQINLVLLTKPDHISGHSMKGSVYYALGNYQLANEEWQYVLSLDPSNREVNEFMKFMKNRKGVAQPPLPAVPKQGAPKNGGKK